MNAYTTKEQDKLFTSIRKLVDELETQLQDAMKELTETQDALKVALQEVAEQQSEIDGLEEKLNDL